MMHVTIENALDVFVHVLVLRQMPLSVEIVISSEKHFSLLGEILFQECLQPGKALALRNFDDRTRFAAKIQGFIGFTIDATMREGRDQEQGECFTLTLRGLKPADTQTVH